MDVEEVGEEESEEGECDSGKPSKKLHILLHHHN